MARPRAFEPEAALDDIMQVFWRKGYEGTSLQDIEAATGLNKQSLYRLYADKRAMYLAALRRYDETVVAQTAAVLREGVDARRKFQRLFNKVLEEASPGAQRWGCFLCNASADQAQLDPQSARFVSAAVERVETVFNEALASSSPYDRNAKARKAAAVKLLAFYFGLRILIKANAPAASLKAALRQVLEEI